MDILKLNVWTLVISSTVHRFLRTGIVSLTFVLLVFFFLGRLLVLYFSLVAPAICSLFFLHVVLYVFLANRWWWWWFIGDKVARHRKTVVNGELTLTRKPTASAAAAAAVDDGGDDENANILVQLTGVLVFSIAVIAFIIVTCCICVRWCRL